MRKHFRKLPKQLHPFLILVAISAILFTVTATNGYVQNKLDQIKDRLHGIQQLENQLTNATFSQNWQEVKENLQILQAELNELSKETWFLGDIQEISELSTQLIDETQKLLPLMEQLPDLPQKIITPQSDSSFSKQIETALISSQTILELSLELNELLEKSLSLKIAGGQSGSIKAIQERINLLVPYLELSATYLPALQDLLGVNSPQKIMVLMQNNAEIRPGGGFIGSFLIIETNDGVITSITPFDSYQVDGQLIEDIPAPLELGPLTDRLTIHDANTNPGFLQNAKLIAELYELAGGPTVDTVIAVNLDFIEEFLRIAPPISADNIELTANNFQPLLNYQIEDIKDETNDPKRVFFDLIPQVISSFADTAKEKPQAITNLLQTAWNKKSFQMYSFNPRIQELAKFLNLDNSYSLPTAYSDELLITHTSLGGNKSDRYLKAKYIHKTEIAQGERIINHLTIRLHHGFNQDSESELRNELGKLGIWYPRVEFIEVLGNSPNKSRYKIYVPESAKLLSVTGLDYDEVTSKPAHDLEGRHLFSFYTEVAPQETKEITLIYEVPYKFKASPIDSYSLYVHKAPGVNQTTFRKEYEIIDDLYIRDSKPLIPVLYDEQKYQQEQPLTQDLSYSVTISR